MSPLSQFEILAIVIGVSFSLMLFGVMWWGKNHPDPDSDRRRDDKDDE